MRRMTFESRSVQSARRVCATAPDLHSQFEDLLHQVWQCEADWRLYDKIDALYAAELRRRLEPRHSRENRGHEGHAPGGTAC